MSRRRAWLGVLAAALLAALALSLPGLLERIATAWLRAELARRGVARVEIGALRVGFRGAHVVDLVLGDDDLRVERIELRYGLRDLLRMRAGEVGLRGVVARARLGEEISLGALGSLASSATSGDGEGGAPPFRELRLADARLELATPLGPIVVPAEAELRAERGALAGSARFRVESDAAKLHGEGHAALRGGEISLEAALAARDLDLGAGEIVALDASLLAAGPAASLAGELSVDLEALLGGGVRAKLSVPARLRGEAGGVTLEEVRCAPLRLDAEGPLRERISLEVPFRSCLESGDAPLLAARAGAGEPVSVRAHLVLRPAPLSGWLPGTQQELAFEGESPRVALAARWSGDAGLRLGATAEQGRVWLGEAGVVAEGFDADVEAVVPPGAGAAGVTAKGSLHALAIADAGEPARFVPLLLSAWLERREGEVVGEARLAGAAGRLDLRAEGTHDPATARGEARIALAPLVFEPGGLGPADLSPRLAATLRALGGRAELSGTLAWEGTELTSLLDLSLQDVSLETDAAALHGLELGLRVVRPWPLQSAPEQRLSVERIAAGLPVEDLSARFEIDAGRLHLAEAQATLLDGSLSAEGVYDPALEENGLVVEIADLDVASLAAELEVDGLSATGRLYGRIPVVLRETGLFVEGGLLDAALPGGTIHYAPAGAPLLPADVQGVDMLLAALRDFRYQELSMTLDGRLAGELAVGLHLLGSNRDFFDGHPVAFNLNLEAPVGSIVQGALVGVEVSEEIRRGLEAGRLQGP